MELLNLMYQYLNRMINKKELLEEIKKIDLSNYSKEDTKEIKQLIENIEKIIKTIPNEIDEVEKKRIKEIDHILSILESGLENKKMQDQKVREFLEKRYQSLQKERKRTCDGGRLYEELCNLLIQNKLIQQYDDRMSPKERLEFITQYISVPCPPILTQEEFEELVNVGIQEDKRESLWRLAFNYYQKQMDFTSIEDYFILKRDDYYLIELIVAVKKDLNMEQLIKKMLATKEKTFLANLVSRGKHCAILTEEEIQKLKEI